MSPNLSKGHFHVTRFSMHHGLLHLWLSVSLLGDLPTLATVRVPVFLYSHQYFTESGSRFRETGLFSIRNLSGQVGELRINDSSMILVPRNNSSSIFLPGSLVQETGVLARSEKPIRLLVGVCKFQSQVHFTILPVRVTRLFVFDSVE